MQVTNIDWNEYQKMIVQLIERIPIDKFSGIYGVPRSGLLIATHLSYQTDLPIVKTPTIDTLVVTDIFDETKTQTHSETLLDYIENYRTASLVRVSGTKKQPTYYVRKTDEWLIMPWMKQDMEVGHGS